MRRSSWTRACALLLLLVQANAWSHTKSETHSVWQIAGREVAVTISIPLQCPSAGYRNASLVGSLMHQFALPMIMGKKRSLAGVLVTAIEQGSQQLCELVVRY